ncbi:transferase hexapeptide repeat containing protein [Chloroherpeton thalassium ATCC 35110]|uniref:Transferase hexapeptide repeat containing protein n=1 Tax=Chloroherpeton thalassium (strain ATCC 35110 / GB-78) TaxID=517418 RepID=B3QVK4_CHLT3|nr:acetyltransferase [Chloroherpeton thalassium]ACF14604.1 transferase hexapeptide repeat containing protein [Chloroherpeton thalassium ATCC 35110]
MSEIIYVLGAGGHAKVLISTLLDVGIVPDGVLDEDEKKHGKKILDVSIIGDFSLLKKQKNIKAIVAIGDNIIRSKIAQKYDVFVNWLNVIHSNAYVHRSVKIGRGSVIMAGAVIQPDVKIGEHVIINTSASVDHDCIIKDHVHVAPGVHLAGGVEIGEGAFLGIASSAVPYVTIGDWSIIGAGAVVTSNIPSKKMAVGVPAKIKKEL